MNLIARSNERAPSALSSTASESPEKTRHEIQSLLSSQAEKHDRTERPVVCPQGGAHQFVIEDDETESELSLGSRSFLHRVNDQVRKRQKQSSVDATGRQRRTFCDMGNVHVFNIASIWIHVEKLLRQLAFHQEFKKSHNETDVRHIWEICVRTRWDLWSENNWLGKPFMEVFVFDWWWASHQSSALKIYVFSDSVLCLGNRNENPRSNMAWEERLTWFQSSPEYRSLNRIDGEPMEFEWNIFPEFTTLQLCTEVQELLSRLSVAPENLTGRIIFMSMFNDISRGSKDNNKECESNAQLVSLFAKRFGAGQWSFLGFGSEKNWCSIDEYSPQGEWDTMAEKWWWHSQKANTQSSEPRVHCPEECSEAKVVENCRSTIVPTRKRLQLFFAQLFL